jgi:hypothetical protein
MVPGLVGGAFFEQVPGIGEQSMAFSLAMRQLRQHKFALCVLQPELACCWGMLPMYANVEMLTNHFTRSRVNTRPFSSGAIEP